MQDSARGAKPHRVCSGIPLADPAAAAPMSPALTGSPREIADRLAAHAEAGADHLVDVLEPCTADTLAQFAEAVGMYREGSAGVARLTSGR